MKGLSTPVQTFHAAVLTGGHSQVDAPRLKPQKKAAAEKIRADNPNESLKQRPCETFENKSESWHHK